jgi:hypothetical protein
VADNRVGGSRITPEDNSRLSRFGRALTGERLAHILDHPEIAGLENAVVETVNRPQWVIQSISDQAARLYYRLYRATPVGDKFMFVVVKIVPGDAFILTAYLTDQRKKGKMLWTANT